MKNKLGNSTWCCKNIDDALALLKESGYLEWDLNTLPFSLDINRMTYVRDFIRDNGEVRFHLPHAYWDIGIKEKSVVENTFSYYCRLFETIKFLGAQYAVIHVGAFAKSDEDTALTNLLKLARYANDNGIRLCVENLMHGLSSNLAFIKKCLEVPHVNMCLDTGHAEVLRREMGDSVFEDISSIKHKIIHAHVYDYEDGNMNHVPFTEESIKANVWLTLLQTTSCEWYTMELDFQDDQDRQKKMVEEYLRKK